VAFVTDNCPLWWWQFQHSSNCLQNGKTVSGFIWLWSHSKESHMKNHPNIERVPLGALSPEWVAIWMRMCQTRDSRNWQFVCMLVDCSWKWFNWIFLLNCFWPHSFSFTVVVHWLVELICIIVVVEDTQLHLLLKDTVESTLSNFFMEIQVTIFRSHCAIFDPNKLQWWQNHWFQEPPVVRTPSADETQSFNCTVEEERQHLPMSWEGSGLVPLSSEPKRSKCERYAGTSLLFVEFGGLWLVEIFRLSKISIFKLPACN